MLFRSAGGKSKGLIRRAPLGATFRRLQGTSDEVGPVAGFCMRV